MRNPEITSSKISSAPARPAAFGEVPQQRVALRQQAVVGRQRLDDRRGNLRAVRVEHAIERLVVVQRDDERVVGDGRGHAGTRRYRLAGETAARAHQHRIGVTVIAAVELEDLRAPGGGARHAQRRHHRFGARRDETNPLGPRNLRRDPLGERQRVRLAAAVGPAVVERLGDDVAHIGIAVAEQQRPEALAEIDEGPAGDVDRAVRLTRAA